MGVEIAGEAEAYRRKGVQVTGCKPLWRNVKAMEISSPTIFFAVDVGLRLAHLPKFPRLAFFVKLGPFRHELRRNALSTSAKKFLIAGLQKLPLFLRKIIGFFNRCILFLCVFSVLFCGCGYTTRAFISKSGYRYIYIEPFVNKVDTTSEFSEGSRFKTYFPLLETVVTNAIVDRYNFDGGLRVAKEGEADLILRGELVKYGRESIREATDDTPEEYRITIYVNISLYDKKKNEVLWERNNFAGDTTYYTTGKYVTSESQAIQNATKDLARRIVELTVEAW